MRVRFLVDYRGHLTNEQFYVAGDAVEFADAVAAQLIADGRAEVVEPAWPVNQTGAGEADAREQAGAGAAAPKRKR
jgi:hypothetical protein